MRGPERFSGTVRPGRVRGRQLGFPTANLQVAPERAAQLPRGVWAGMARWEGEPWRGALINIGTRPTFAEQELSIEAHVLDFSGDLYGKTLEVELVRRLRAEQRFASVEALVEQLEKDRENAREILNATSDGGMKFGDYRR